MAIPEGRFHIIRMSFIYVHVVRAVLGRLAGGVVDAEEMRAGEYEVAQDIFADGEKGGDEAEVELGRLFDPGQRPVRQRFEELDASKGTRYAHHCRP